MIDVAFAEIPPICKFLIGVPLLSLVKPPTATSTSHLSASHLETSHPNTSHPSASIREIKLGHTPWVVLGHQLRNVDDDHNPALGAESVATSLLSIASSYSPEVLRCLSQLILSALEQPVEASSAPSIHGLTSLGCESPNIVAICSCSSISVADSLANITASPPAPQLAHQVGSSLNVGDSSDGIVSSSSNYLRDSTGLCGYEPDADPGTPINTGAQAQMPPGRSRTRPLTRSEGQVAELVSKGLSLKEVATQLFVSRKTAEFHLQSVYRKLNVHNRGQFATAFFHLQNAA